MTLGMGTGEERTYYITPLSKGERAGSDLDLVVVGKPLPRKLNQDIREVESRLNREINFYSRKEFDKERQKDGGFLNLILKDKVIILKGTLNAR